MIRYRRQKKKPQNQRHASPIGRMSPPAVQARRVMSIGLSLAVK